MRARLARSAGLIGLATLTSRVLGMARDVVQGAFFGTSAAADAFTVATRFPGLLRDLFAEGAMSAALVPTLSAKIQTEGKEAAWRLGAQVINALTLVTGAIVVLAIVFAEPIVTNYASGYKDTPEKLALTVSLARINMPFLALIAIATGFMGMLNSIRKFFVPALSPALYNVVFILCTVIFVPVFMNLGIQPVMALSAGMLLGGVAQIVAQWPALWREGYRHRWILDWRDPGLRQILMLMGPGVIGVAAAQINLLVNTTLATREEGAAAALNFAFRLMYMPIGIFGVSVATAALPELARHGAAGSHEHMRTTLSWGVRLMLMLSVPATVGLIVLARPIVELIFQRGQFNDLSTVLTVASLMCYAPGIVGYSIVKIAGPTFYSLQDARTPVVVSIVTMVVNLVLNLWLNSIMGFRGLALGTAIAANVNAGLLLYLLSRRIDGVEGGRLAISFGKILAASIVMGAAAYWSEAWLHSLLPNTLLGYAWTSRLVRVVGGIGAGLATLAVTAWVLRIDEFRQVMKRMVGRFEQTGPEDLTA